MTAIVESPPTAEARRPDANPTIVRGFCAVGAAVLAYWCVSSGWMLGVPLVLVVVAAVLLTPTAENLSARIVVNGSVAITVVPVIAALPLGVTISPGALLVALSSAALITGVKRGSVLPSVQAIDALPPAAALIGALAMKEWLLAANPQQALIRLLPGFDYSGHFDMFELLRQHGKTIADLGRGPGGSPWLYHGYPMGYHALCAMLVDLFGGTRGTAHEVVVFTQANGVVVTFGLVLVVAGLCSLPGLRRAPAYAPVATLILTCAVLTGPGASAISNGFVNFWLAALMVSLAIVVATIAYLPLSARVIVVQSLMAAVAYAWFPLIVLGVPALVILLGGHGLRPARRGLFVLLPGTVIASIALAQIFPSLTSGGDVVNADGGILQSQFLLVASAIIVALVLLFSARSDCAATGSRMWWVPRHAQLTYAPILACFCCAALASYQLLTAHQLTYYFIKFLTGADLVLGVLLVVAVLTPLNSVSSEPQQPAPLLGRVGIAALVLVSCAFVIPGDVVGPAQDRSGTAVLGPTDDSNEIVGDLLAAARWTLRDTRHQSEIWYLPLGPGRSPDARASEQWYLALTRRLTVRNATRLTKVGTYRNRAGAVRAARKLGERVELLTRPDEADSVRISLRATGSNQSVISWSGPNSR